jgi:hypothetical protein
VGSPATLLVIGANPWLAHGFPNVREHLNEIKKDPARRLIVIDPRRSETAQIAMMHMFCGVAWLAAKHQSVEPKVTGLLLRQRIELYVGTESGQERP